MWHVCMTRVPRVQVPRDAVRGVWKHPTKLVQLEARAFDELVSKPGKLALYAVKNGVPGFVAPAKQDTIRAWTAEMWVNGSPGVEVRVRRRLGKVLDTAGKPLLVGVDERGSLMLYKVDQRKA